MPGVIDRLWRRLTVGDRHGPASHTTTADTLLPERLAQMGLDAAALKANEPATYRELARACAHCASGERCAHDLAVGDTATGQGTYCRNGGALETLVDSLPGERPGRPDLRDLPGRHTAGRYD